MSSCRLPLIRQTEVAECGLACLAMIASHHGLHTDLATDFRPADEPRKLVAQGPDRQA